MKDKKEDKFVWVHNHIPTPSGKIIRPNYGTSVVEKLRPYQDWWSEMLKLQDALKLAYKEVLEDRQLRMMKARRPGFSTIPPRIEELEKRVQEKFREIYKIEIKE